MTRHDDRNHLDAQAQVEALDPALTNRFAKVLDLLVEQGFDGMAHATQTLLNEAMKLERSIVLGARPYERTPERRGYANGYQPKTMPSRIGRLHLQVPQTRDVEFYPSALERGPRSERALVMAVAEMRAPRAAWSARRLDPQGYGRDGGAVWHAGDQQPGKPRHAGDGRGVGTVAQSSAGRDPLSAA